MATQHRNDDEEVLSRSEELRARLAELSRDDPCVEAIAAEAAEVLGALSEREQRLTTLSRRLASVSAESAELLADLEERNEELDRTSREVARANAEAAELMAEVELKNEEIQKLNRSLSQANARAAELVAELECRTEELQEANSALTRANDEKSRLLGVAAHDLRGGIGGIGGLADLLGELVGEEHGEVSRHVRLIHDESTRLLDLLASLLDVSRVAQGRLGLAPGPMFLSRTVEQALEFHTRLAERKDQTITVSYPDGSCAVLADQRRIRQVLDNLISNAIKYSPPGAEIILRVWTENDEVAMSVCDRGPGLTEEDLAKLFQSFERLSAKPTGGEDSHGLGLAIARKVIELHGGRIWGRNRTDGTGACFGFALPSGRETAPEEGGEASAAATTVLIVDDNPVNRTLARRLVTKTGNEAKAVASGEAAIEALSRQRFGLILLDLEMPGMSGCDTVGEIRGQAGAAALVPVIAMTAHTEQACIERCIAAGMDDYVVKPVSYESLSAVVSRWAGREHSRG